MKQKNYTSLILLLCLWVLGVGNVKGQILTEQFNYGAVSDSLSFISGTVWNGHSLGGASLTNPIQYVAGSNLSLGSYPTLGGKVTFTTSGQDINSTLSSAVTSGTLYYSFLVNITSAQTAGDYFIHTGPSPIGSGFNNRVFARLSGGNLQFGIQKTSTGPATYGTNNYSTGTTYLIVVKYQFNTGSTTDDVSSLYVFTTTAPLTEPGATEATNSAGTDPTSLQTIAIRQGTAANAPAGEIDYIRVGTTWADVTSVPSATPTITLGSTSLTGFTTTVGTPSTAQQYGVSGSNLTGFPSDIVVTAPTGYEVSLTSGSGFSGSVNVAYTSATLSNTTIFVRIAASASVGSPSGNITNAGGGATTQNVAVSGTVNAPPATLTVNPTSLSGFTTVTGTASTEQSYTLSGTDLTGFPANITVTAPTGYEVSLTSGSGFAGSVNVAYASATLSNTTIFVRIAASASVGSPSGNITNAGGGATTQNVAVSGNVNPLTPTLNVNPTSLSGFTTITGTASAEQSYTLSGTNLTGFPDNILVTAPTGYEVSLTSGSGFGGSVNVAYTSATLSNTTIFVRIAASASVGSPSGNVTNAGGGATTQNVAVSGTVNPVPTPTLTVNPTSLSGFTTTAGTASANQSYTLSGVNLTGFPSNIVVTAPTGYEVSLTSGSGFGGSVNVAYTSATLSNTTIFVRIAASASVGSPSGNVTNAGGGATTQNVAVSGTVNAAPTVVPIANIRNAIDGSGAQVAPYAAGTAVMIQGQIYGVNRNIDATVANGTKQKFEFTVIDNSTGRNGIVIRSTGTVDIAPVDMLEGDNITVSGTVSQFNGLTQITATSVTRNSTGNTRKTPVSATVIAENEESQLIRLTGVTVTAWPTLPHTGSGVNATITVGANTYTLRITSASELFNKSVTDVFGTGATLPVNNVTMVGLGGQFDNASPFDSGYQLFVTKLSDVTIPPPIIPAISTNAPSTGLDFGNVAKNTVSTSQTYKLIGKDLPTTGSNLNVVVNVPNNFQVSKNNTDFFSTISFTNAEVNNAGTTGLDVYVRFAPVSDIDGAKGGDVTHSVPSIVPTLNANVAVKGVQTAPLSIADELASQVNIYPNPTNGMTIKIDAPQDFVVEMLDITGRKVANFNSSEPKLSDNLPNGLYFLQFSNGTTKFVKRLVIQK
ncbi:hypothetical protein AD998_05265 [bacterium 336/3]|nr:hypothetical protein AD998_05265 [bacterium 336/3]